MARRPWLRARFGIAVSLVWVGCGPQWVELGSPPAGEASTPSADAGMEAGGMSDAASETDGAVGRAPRLWLEVLGRPDVVRIESCGEPCIDVTLRVEGGVPPYAIRWDDGRTGNERSLCVDPTRPRSLVVQDASDGRNPPATLGLPPLVSAESNCQASGWIVCRTIPLSKDSCSDNEALSVALADGVSVEGQVAGWALVSPVVGAGTYDTWLSATACGMDESLSSYVVAPPTAPSSEGLLRFGLRALEGTFRHLVITPQPYYGPLGQFGPLMTDPAPTEVTALELCEHGLSGS